jgi:hypothetical protein
MFTPHNDLDFQTSGPSVTSCPLAPWPPVLASSWRLWRRLYCRPHMTLKPCETGCKTSPKWDFNTCGVLDLVQSLKLKILYSEATLEAC